MHPPPPAVSAGKWSKRREEFKGNMGDEGSQSGDPRKESCHQGHRSISVVGRESVPLRGLRPEGSSGSVAARRLGPARASGVWPVRQQPKGSEKSCLALS